MSKCALSLGHNLENLSASVLIASDTPSEFLYVEIDIAALNTRFGGTLNEDTIMTISWEGKSCLLTDLGDGVLLLPLASNADWASESAAFLFCKQSLCRFTKGFPVLPFHPLSCRVHEQQGNAYIPASSLKE